MAKITCDECGHEFDRDKIKVFEEQLDPEVKERYFLCPECQARYRVQLLDREIAAVADRRRTITRLIGAARDQHDAKRIRELIKEDERLKKRQMKHESSLSRKYPKKRKAKGGRKPDGD